MRLRPGKVAEPSVTWGVMLLLPGGTSGVVTACLKTRLCGSGLGRDHSFREVPSGLCEQERCREGCTPSPACSMESLMFGKDNV